MIDSSAHWFTTPLLLGNGELEGNLPDEFYQDGDSLDYLSRRHQKDAGAYYTDEHLAEALAQIAVDRKVTPIVERVKDAAENGVDSDVRKFALQALALKICDPMVGGGVFLSKIVPLLENALSTIRETATGQGITDISAFSSESSLENHIYSRMLYGVDLDEQALANACANIAENSNSDLNGPEIRHLLAPNLKCGNSLLDPVYPDDWPNRAALNFPVKLGEFVEQRKELQGSIHKAETLHSILSTKIEILQRTAGNVLDDFPDWYWEEDQPFCWPIEYPEVFYGDDGRLLDSPGFDIVIGNPPWDVVKYNDREFFDTVEPGFSRESRAERDRMKEELLEDSEIKADYERYVNQIEEFLDFVKSNAYYRHQMSGRYGHSYNKYKLAIELSFNIANSGGEVILITPSGILGEAGSTALRELLFEQASIDSFWAFKARSDVFADVDQNPCIEIYSKGGSTELFRCVDGIESVDEFIRLYNSEDTPEIPGELVREAAPETFSLIAARDSRALSVLDTLYEHPLASDSSGDYWSVTPSREIDETNDREHIVDEQTSYRFVKGRCVFPMKVDPSIVDKWVEDDFLESTSEDFQHSRVAWRDIARPSLRRRMFVTVIPPDHGIGNSLNYVVPEQSEEEKIYLASVMQSWVFEYRARQISANSHLNMYVIRQVPVPRFPEENGLFQEIVSEAREIMNRDVEESVRVEVMNKIDALVAHAFGLTAAEFEFILDSYDKLEEETKRSMLNEFAVYEGTSMTVMGDD